MYIYLPRHLGAAKVDATPEHLANAPRAKRQLPVLLVELPGPRRQEGAQLP